MARGSRGDDGARLIVILLALALAFSAIWGVLSSLTYALATVYILQPLHNLILKLVRSRLISTTLLVVLLVIPFIYATIWGATNTYSFLISNYPRLQETYISRIGNLLESYPQLARIAESFELEQAIRRILTSSLEIARSITDVIIKTIVYLVAVFYLLLESDNLSRRVSSILDQQFGEGFSREIDRKIRGFIYGHVATSLFAGVIASIGFKILGSIFGESILMNFPFLLGAICALLVFIPLIGAWLLYIPMTMYFLLTGKIALAVSFFVFSVLSMTLIPDLILRPYFSSRFGRIDPLAVIAGFFGGLYVFGISGFVLGPLLITIASSMIERMGGGSV